MALAAPSGTTTAPPPRTTITTIPKAGPGGSLTPMPTLTLTLTGTTIRIITPTNTATTTGTATGTAARLRRDRVMGLDAAAGAADDARALLTLVQWLSPAFPVGGFAYSHGLEWAVAAGELRDAAAVRSWLGDVLSQGAGRTDAILLAHALRPDADHAALAALARALAPSAERQRETDEQGAAFARAAAALTGRAVDPAPLPVALGQAAAPLGLPVAQVVALALHAFAANVTAAATRFVPLGQTEAQALLAALHPLILRLADAAAAAPLEAIGSASLRADLASMRHETLDVRIFRT